MRRGRYKAVLLTAGVAAALYVGAFVAYFVFGECQGVDFFDDPNYRCNTAMDVALVLFLLGAVVTGLTLILLSVHVMIALTRRITRAISRRP